MVISFGYRRLFFIFFGFGFEFGFFVESSDEEVIGILLVGIDMYVVVEREVSIVVVFGRGEYGFDEMVGSDIIFGGFGVFFDFLLCVL